VLTYISALCQQLTLQSQGGDTTGDGEPQDAGMGGPTGTGSVIVGSTKKGRAGRPDVWHRHNAIFVLNPSKVCNVTCHTALLKELGPVFGKWQKCK
jgi:hypothetical protein